MLMKEGEDNQVYGIFLESLSQWFFITFLFSFDKKLQLLILCRLCFQLWFVFGGLSGLYSKILVL